MWLFIEEQRGNAFLYACVWGCAIGLLYDAFRVIRAVFGTGRTRLFFEDLLFCIMAAVLFMLCCFNVSLGIIRMFILFGVVAGFFFYKFTVGLFTVRFVQWLKSLILVPINAFMVKLVLLRNKFCAIVYTSVKIRSVNKAVYKF